MTIINDLAKSIAFIVLGKNDIEYELPSKDEYSRVDYLYISRYEISEGIRSICKEYGVSSMVDFLF